MPRDYVTYLDDIENSILRINSYIQDMNYESFVLDIKTQDAVIRNLEIIGEAVKSLPSDFINKKEKNIPWNKIAGIRDILIHAYFNVDLQIIWDVIQNKLVDLKEACSRLKK